tara:strand:+ start:893 stop:1582 length:690 start_codon:yes stop_codon:yes gene_type:complete
MQDLKKITFDGLWRNNPGLVQLLGLCPLLAVTNSLVNAIGLGLATLFVLVFSNLIVSALRHFIPHTIRIPVFVMVIAALVTSVQLLMNAYMHELYLSLGIFLPLIVTNCIIIGRAESFASRNNAFKSVLDGFMMGLGFMIVLMILGALRELVGQGTLFMGAEALFGSWGAQLGYELIHFENDFLIAILPPGAFFAMGFLIALKNWIDMQYQSKQSQQQNLEIQRARVTG